MGNNKHNAKIELKQALGDVVHAHSLLDQALRTVEKEDNKQLLQNTLSNVKQALTNTRTSAYGYKEE